MFSVDNSTRSRNGMLLPRLLCREVPSCTRDCSITWLKLKIVSSWLRMLATPKLYACTTIWRVNGACSPISFSAVTYCRAERRCSFIAMSFPSASDAQEILGPPRGIGSRRSFGSSDCGGSRPVMPAELAPRYSNVGRPSIDPAPMIRMLVIGYVFAMFI